MESSTSSAEEGDYTFGDFLFTQTGQYVAVYYDDDFHVGSVINIISPELAEVNFMKKCSVSNNTFLWPQKPDQDKIAAMFVFDSDFDIASQNGRVWSVVEHSSIAQKYNAYKQKYSD